MKKVRIDLIWQRFWKLTAISPADVTKHWRLRWNCRCDCWNNYIVVWSHLRNWNTKSCWCIRKERNNNISHWMGKTRIYGIWCSMKYRCYNKNSKDYMHYWERWIKVLWKTFEAFRDDMYDSYLEHVKGYWEKETTIDRINNNWNYEKTNCKWSTYNEQANNRRPRSPNKE